MLKSICLAMLGAMAVAVSAQAAPRKAAPVPAPAAQSYCPDATTLVRTGGSPDRVVFDILHACQSGARLMLPMGNNYVIMHVCDLNKGLQSIGNEVMCSMVAPLPESLCAQQFRAAFPDYKADFIPACEGSERRGR